MVAMRSYENTPLGVQELVYFVTTRTYHRRINGILQLSHVYGKIRKWNVDRVNVREGSSVNFSNRITLYLIEEIEIEFLKFPT